MKNLITNLAIRFLKSLTVGDHVNAQIQNNTLQDTVGPVDQSTAINHCHELPDPLENGVHAHLFPILAHASINLLTTNDNGQMFEPKTYDELNLLNKNFSIKDKQTIEETKKAIVQKGGYNGEQFFYKNVCIDQQNKNITIKVEKTDYATMKSLRKLQDHTMQEHRTGALTPCYSISCDTPTFNNYLATQFDLTDDFTDVQSFCRKTIYLAIHHRKDTWRLRSHPGGFVQWIPGNNGKKLLYDPQYKFSDVYQNTAVIELVEETLLTPLNSSDQTINEQINYGVQELMDNKKDNSKYLVAKPIEKPTLALIMIRNNAPNSQSQSVDCFYPTLFKVEDLPKLNNHLAPDSNEHQGFEIVPIAHLSPTLQMLGLSDDFRLFAKNAPGIFLYGAGASAVLVHQGLLNNKIMNEIKQMFPNSPGNNSCCFFKPPVDSTTDNITTIRPAQSTFAHD